MPGCGSFGAVGRIPGRADRLPTRVLREIEYELERIVEHALLAKGEVPDSLPKSAGVHGADHLAEHLRHLAFQGDLRVEAGWE